MRLNLLHAIITELSIPFVNYTVYDNLIAAEITFNLINSAAQLLSKTLHCFHISSLLASLYWLPVKFRIEVKILTFTFLTYFLGIAQFGSTEYQ